jgi:hypothetical protein
MGRNGLTIYLAGKMSGLLDSEMKSGEIYLNMN